jgi:hypothetical protein
MRGISKSAKDFRELLDGVKQHPQEIELALECISPKARCELLGDVGSRPLARQDIGLAACIWQVRSLTGNE